ncbi:unnamed protein product, partial [Durusdinium trenchii]
QWEKAKLVPSSTGARRAASPAGCIGGTKSRGPGNVVSSMGCNGLATGPGDEDFDRVKQHERKRRDQGPPDGSGQS